jgi:hypothetical protein
MEDYTIAAKRNSTGIATATERVIQLMYVYLYIYCCAVQKRELNSGQLEGTKHINKCGSLTAASMRQGCYNVLTFLRIRYVRNLYRIRKIENYTEKRKECIWRLDEDGTHIRDKYR